MSKEKVNTKKEAGANVEHPDIMNNFVKAYSKCGKDLKFHRGKKYVEGFPRGDFSKVQELVDALKKAGLTVIPDTKGDMEPVVYTENGFRVALIGIRNGYYFSVWKPGSSAIKVHNDKELETEVKSIIAIAEELEKNKKLREPVRSTKKKFSPDNISALKKRIANLSPNSKGINIKLVNGEIKEWATKEGYTLTEKDDGTGILKL